jgi:hypothetical protein
MHGCRAEFSVAGGCSNRFRIGRAPDCNIRKEAAAASQERHFHHTAAAVDDDCLRALFPIHSDGNCCVVVDTYRLAAPDIAHRAFSHCFKFVPLDSADRTRAPSK